MKMIRPYKHGEPLIRNKRFVRFTIGGKEVVRRMKLEGYENGVTTIVPTFMHPMLKGYQSKYMPHQGEQEKARRVRQIQRDAV